MSNQLTSNAEALRLFFNEDIYLVKNELQNAFVEPVKTVVELAQPEIVAKPKQEVKVIEEQVVLPKMVEEPLPTYKKELNFEFLGKNQKGILILVNDNINKVSSVEGTELLRKLVKAIALTNNDFALVNYANCNGASYDDLHKFFSCKLLLSFGVDTKTLGLGNQPLHQLIDIAQTKMVFTANLHDLDSDIATKKMLWGTLQQIKVNG